jgi:hypothetical protein
MVSKHGSNYMKCFLYSNYMQCFLFGCMDFLQLYANRWFIVQHEGGDINGLICHLTY